MAGHHLAVVTAKHKGAAKSAKHKHPVRHMRISPTDNGGYSVETEMYPKSGKGERDMYQPGETQSAAFGKFKDMHKHVALMLKTDAAEQGDGEGAGGDPGSTEEAK